MISALSLLRQALPSLPIAENEPMRRHCSFRIGGPCTALVQPRTREELLSVLRILHEAGEAPLIIGNGTNLLVTDEALDRIVIKTDKLCSIRREGDTGLYAEAGVSLARLATAASEYGLSGLEFAHGIPGTLGGAAMMNAGAYGGEMKDVLESTDCADCAGELYRLAGDEQALSYRHSVFEDRELIVLGCTLRLAPGEQSEITSRMTELMKKRKASQPLDLPSAGSTFKRPASGYAAAMIDEAGLKGFRVGGAAVSEKHAGFVVNLGGASFGDVLAVMDHVQNEVEKRFGVRLEPEVRIIR